MTLPQANVWLLVYLGVGAVVALPFFASACWEWFAYSCSPWERWRDVFLDWFYVVVGHLLIAAFWPFFLLAVGWAAWNVWRHR